MKTISNRTRRTLLVVINLALILALMAAILPNQPATAATTATCSVNYTVQSGDTLTSIAAKYNVTVAALAAANNLTEPYNIYVGQVLCIPGTATSTTTTSGSKTDIKVDKWTTSRITISITGLTKKIPYIVRVSKDQWGSKTYFVLGRMKTDKTGAATKTFILPKALRDRPYLWICVKNSFNDIPTCKGFWAP